MASNVSLKFIRYDEQSLRLFKVHAQSNDFKYQENVRRMDLAIRDVLKNVSEDFSRTFCSHGWGQMIAIVHLLSTKEWQDKVSPVFRMFVDEQIDQAMVKVKDDTSILKINVRDQTKKILEYPLSWYSFLWEKVKLDQHIQPLNELLQKYPPKFKFIEDKLLLTFEGKINIFEELWKTNFSKDVNQLGRGTVKPNFKIPKMTLLFSSIIAEIEQSFKNEDKKQFKEFMEKILNELNSAIIKESSPFKITEFVGSHSLVVPAIEYCVAALFEAPFFTKALEIISVRLR